jgi:hypothetical protein
MPDVYFYLRQAQRKPKTLHRIRLGVVVPQAATEAVFNLSDPFGCYARLSRRNGNLVFSYSNHGTPPFAYERTATASGEATEGRFAWHPTTKRITLLYTEDGNVYQKTNDSDGFYLFSGRTLVKAGASHPDLVIGPVGPVLITYYVAGALMGYRYELGETSGSEFTLKDDTATDLVVEDDVHRIAIDRNGQFWLHVRIDGEADTSLWFSNDAETWEREAGAVPGIPSGTFPGIAAGHDGSLLAWAVVSNTLKRTYRDPGDTAFGAVTTVKDDAAADLGVSAASHSFALAWEDPERWVLAYTPSGGTTVPADRESSDAGATTTEIPDPAS